MQLPAFERRVAGRLAEQIAHRDAVDDEGRRRVEVREDEDSDGSADRRSDPARRSDPGLVALRHHPGPAADRALRHGAAARGSDRTTDVGRLDLDDASLGEPAVVALAHDGDDEVLRADARIGCDRDLDRPVVHAADGVGGGEVHGRLDQAPLRDDHRARQLARAVQHGHARGHGCAVQRLDRRGKDGRDARACDAPSVRRLGLVAPDGDVADRDAVDVGDRIRSARPRSGRSADRARGAEGLGAEEGSRGERTDEWRAVYAPRVVAVWTIQGYGRAQLRWCQCRQNVRGNDSGKWRRHEAEGRDV